MAAMRVTTCRVCDSRTILPVLDLGMMPVPNRFPQTPEEVRNEELFPLRFSVCQQCMLAMIDEVVPPEKLFSTYHYLTSASAPLAAHFRDLAREARERFSLGAGARILDIGANDGTLLKEFQDLGMLTLGVDPAKNVATIARTRGIDVLPEFFSSALAGQLKAKGAQFDLVTATNVFAHTHDIQDVVRGVRDLLAPDGVFLVEFAHLLEMVDKKFFDVIYHEHLSFFALEPLVNFFARHGMRVFDVKKVLTQGGSLRLYVTHAESLKHPSTERIQQIIEEEHAHGLHRQETYDAFAQTVSDYRASMRSFLQDLRRQGKRIVGIGAPAKGVILLNYCRVDEHLVEYIVDSTPLKQHRLLPGVHIPVFPEEKLAEDPVDYFLLLAYNFKDEIVRKLSPYLERGTKMIVPFPTIHVVEWKDGRLVGDTSGVVQTVPVWETAAQRARV